MNYTYTKIYMAGTFVFCCITGSLIGSMIPTNTDYTLEKYQAKAVIEDLVDRRCNNSWWNTFFDAQKYDEVKNIKKDLVQDIINSPDNYIRDNNSIQNIKYSRSRVEQRTLAGLLDVIAQRAYRIAYNKTNNCATAQKIKEIITNEVTQNLTQNRSVDIYLSSHLERKVSSTLNQLYPPYTPPQRLYPSDECCVCFTELSSHNRIFLKNCGHDICSSCLRTMIYEHRETTCPLCRTIIDLEDAYQKLSPYNH